MDFATRKKYYNRCDPNEPLEPNGDDRNVDLDRFGPIRVRGTNWVERLASRIELSDKPVFELFTGLRGSGKSTELKRLAGRLRDPGPARARLFPVYIDADDFIDLTSPIDVPDVITVILFATEAAILEEEGKDSKKAEKDGPLTRLLNWVKEVDVELTKAEYAIGGLKFVTEMKNQEKSRLRYRDIIAAKLTRFLELTSKEMVDLNARAIACGYTGLVVLFDSLEKLRGSSTTWTSVLESAEQIFTSGAPYLRLPVHVLYTIPPAVVARRFELATFMPMMKLKEKNGSPFRPGVDAARELVRRRVPDDVLKDLLGPQAEERIEELLLWTGGYPREIVRILRSAFAQDHFPLTDKDLKEIIGFIRDGYRKIVPVDAFPWLASVAREQYMTPLSDDHRQTADLMLQNNAVLRYLDEEGDWYDLHPAVHEIPGVIAAKQSLASPGSSANEPGR